jgi:hypothetical protein
MKKTYIQIRLTQEEKENFRENAKMFRLSMTGYINFLNATINIQNKVRDNQIEKNI